MQAFANTRFAPSGAWSQSRFCRIFLFLLPLILATPPQSFADCQQTNVPANYITSWDSYGYQNFFRLAEGSVPDTEAGKGPYPDRNNPSILKLSYNVFAFQIPQLSGTFASAELRLQIRYLVSFRGSEDYELTTLTDPGVKVKVHRYLGAPVYDDPDPGAIYGRGTISQSDSLTMAVELSDDFIAKVTAAAGYEFIMQGSIPTLDNDPYDAEYLYVDRATLVLTYADSGLPQITSQPAGHTINAGSDVEFHVSACGALPLFYQWRFNDAELAGATNASLLLFNAGPAQAGNYSVTVSNSIDGLLSGAANLQVNQSAPFFAIQPLNQTNDAGNMNVHLRAVAGGAPPPDYQWRFNGTDLPGATNNVLPFTLVTPADAGTYTVVASNLLGSVTSNPCLFSVVPFYFNGPQDETVLLDNPALISVYTTGQIPPTALSWFHDGVEIDGATNDYYNFIGTPKTAGEYFVIGSNQYGSLTSRVAAVTVVQQAPQFSGSIKGASLTFVAGETNFIYTAASGGSPPVFFWYHDGILIPDQYENVLTVPNTTLGDAGQYSMVASNEVGMATNGSATVSVTPALVWVSPYSFNLGLGSAIILTANYQGVFPMSYQWFHDANANDTTFHGTILPGETNATFLLTAVTSSQAGLYAVAVTNIYGSITSAPAQMYLIKSPASVWNLPASVTNRVGDFVWLSGTFGGAPRPTCQWKFNGADIPGATNYILALSNISTQQSGAYSVVTSNPLGTNFSSTSVLSVATSGPLDDWTSLNPVPQANPLAAVAFGNGRRVAVGENGTVLVSTDGRTWSGRHLGTGIHLSAINFGNGTFVAVGHADFDLNFNYSVLPVIFTSPDGNTWTSRSLSARGRLSGVAFGNSRFVAIGAWDYTTDTSPGVPVALTSADGIVWEPHYLPGSILLAPLSAICFGNGQFVAVSDLGYSQPSIFSSPDGAHWTTCNANLNRNLQAVTAADSTFVAVGDAGAVARSSDGINWTVGAANFPVPFKAVAYGDGEYVAVGDNGATVVSSDAVSWQPVTVPSTHDISGLLFDGTQFTAVGDTGRILVSSNGTSWTDQCLGPDSDLYGIAQGPDSFVAVGDGALLRSTDGINWVQLNSTRKLHGITYGGGLFVAVGKKGAILTSPEGLIWTTRSVSTTGYVERVICANNRFVGVGEAGLIVTSPDAITWTKVPEITSSDLEGIAYGNGIYVAVGGYFPPRGAVATVLTSPDGEHWTDQASVDFLGVRARDVTFANGIFVLVGNDGLTAWSSNGESWEDRFIDYYDNFRAVTYAAGNFVAVGNNGILFSSRDGANWIKNRSFASMNLRDVIATSDAVLTVGSNGEILQSGELRPGILARAVTGGFELNVSGGLVPECRVQASEDLAHWTDLFIYTNTVPAAYLDSSGMPKRFYRLIPR